MKCIDPATMSPEQRLAELGELLAAGIQRFFARESKRRNEPQITQNQLAATRDAEAPCGASQQVPA